MLGRKQGLLGVLDFLSDGRINRRIQNRFASQPTIKGILTETPVSSNLLAGNLPFPG
jgi:hypothetical protein